ncbi:NAD(P)-dependent oxidoreductase [Streptomyces olivoreticuli]
MNPGNNTPRALILADPGRIPEPWRTQVADTVSATWCPEGLSRFPENDPRLAAFTTLVAMPYHLDAAALSRLPALRLLITTSTAVHSVDLDHCRARGITVRNITGYAGPAVAEHAFALLLASLRGVRAAEAVAQGDVPALELAGRTAGVIGLGDIGSRIARIAMGFGMRVLFTSRTPRSLDGALPRALSPLLTAADVVFLAVPLTPATRHLFDAARLRAMKSTAQLISISPEEVIDLPALRQALREGIIAGAALDISGVIERFHGVPRLTLTHRLGTHTQECARRRAEHWVRVLRACVDAGLG